MSAPQKNISEFFNLSSWTVISSQGDILATDCDSESSESSIEVVSLEGSEIVAFSSRHLEGRINVSEEEENASIQSDMLVVTNTSPSACLTDPEPIASGLDYIKLQEPVSTVEDVIITTPNRDATCSLIESLGKLDEKESFTESHSVADHSHDFKYQNYNEDTSHDTIHQNDHEDIPTVPAVDTLIATNSDLLIDKPLALALNDTNDNPHNEIKDRAQGGENNSINDEERIPASKDSVITTYMHQDNTEMQAARCLELLVESFEESGIFRLLGDSTNLNSAIPRNDSDTDSDFVRLDSDLDLDEGDGRVVMAMHRSDSSIGPTFSFMRAEGSHEQKSPLRMIVNPGDLNRDDNTRIVNPEDLDRDDDTESSTEDGVDDRIESEQSEADSFSINNDVGDLSMFSDIGDLPLDVGNVPRNYIHCPNNHLSTVLNIIVIIAAILTMGISLGIIMATDLEIEEWQNAYEVQNNKVYLLELQLQGKMKALEYKEKRVNELEPQLHEMKSIAKMLKGRASSYETAMDILIESALMRKDSTEDGLHLLKKVVKDFVNCEESNHDGSGACYLKVFAFSERYVVLKNPSILEETKQLSDKNTGNNSKDLETESKMTIPDKESVPAEMNPISSKVGDVVKQDHKMMDSMPKAFSAFLVPIDIKHLQQSLTREQQRALYWQQLYLAERRQRERERENEEWEDERDRELWEYEKEQLEQVECHKKLVSTNISMFAQHIGRWNLSVFDDFANLSLLLSGVAELKQSVFDSIHQVLEWREIQGEHPPNVQESISDKKMLYSSVIEVLNEIKDWPNKETLVEGVWNRISDVKQILKYIDSNKIWVGADHIINKFDNIKFASENSKLSRLQTIELIVQVFTDLKQELATEDNVVEDLGKALENSGEVLPEQIYLVDKFSSHKNGGKKKNSWHKQLGKIIKKTGVTVGQKVKKTWHNLKTLWHNKKKTWQNLKTMWLEKKPSIINIAKGLKNRVMKVSSKFKKLCTDLPKALFRQGNDMVDIHSKFVYKARKQWQKEVYSDPCKVLGKFTAECNSDRKHIKKKLKRINHLFTQLLKIATINHVQALNLRTKRIDVISNQFRDFQKQWGSTKLLLKTDLDWVDCQSIWWLNAANSIHKNNEEINKCNNIRLLDNLHEEHCRECHLENHMTRNLKSELNEELHGNDINNEYVLSASEKEGFSISVDGSHKEYTSKNNNDLEVNDTESLDEVWFLERARYKLQNRREKEASDWVFESSAEARVKQLPQKWGKLDDEVPQSAWVFKKAQYRENKRKEEHRADWLLERSDSHLPCYEGIGNCIVALKYSQNQYESGNWYLKQAEYRQKIRQLKGASDWLFERAAQRKKMLKTSKFGRMNMGAFNDRDHFKPIDHHYTKPYQQAHGKASCP